MKIDRESPLMDEQTPDENSMPTDTPRMLRPSPAQIRSILTSRPVIASQSIASPGKLVVKTQLATGFYRCDLCTLDNGFDCDTLYVQKRFRPTSEGGNQPAGEAFRTGPWDWIDGEFLVPRARVTLNEHDIGELWFDLPEMDLLARRAIKASFGFDVYEAGEQTLTIHLDDARLGASRFHAGVIRADERAHDSQPVLVVPKGRPRLFAWPDACITAGHDDLSSRIVQAIEKAIIHQRKLLEDTPDSMHGGALMPQATLAWMLGFMQRIRPDACRLQELQQRMSSIIALPHWGGTTAGQMGCDNDIVAGRILFKLACLIDWLDDRIDRTLVVAARRKLAVQTRRMVSFARFQRSYWPTAYGQNHFHASMLGVMAGAIVLHDHEPDAPGWLAFAVRSFHGVLGRLSNDGGGDASDVCYGMSFFLRAAAIVRHALHLDLTHHPFFSQCSTYLRSVNRQNYASSNAYLAFVLGDALAGDELLRQIQTDDPSINPIVYLLQYGRKLSNINMPQPACRVFEDSGNVVMREGYGPDDLSIRMHYGPPTPYSNLSHHVRYEGVHHTPAAGNVLVSIGSEEQNIVTNAGPSYRKQTCMHNCVTINQQGQWGENFVWFPKLKADQCATLIHYENRPDQCITRVDLTQVYPPELGLQSYCRTLVYLKPHVLRIIDELLVHGDANFQWHMHARQAIEPVAHRGIFKLQGREKWLYLQDLRQTVSCIGPAPQGLYYYRDPRAAQAHITFNQPAVDGCAHFEFLLSSRLELLQSTHCSSTTDA